MLATRYNQIVEMVDTEKINWLHIGGIAIVLLSFTFVACAIALNVLYVIGFVLLFSIGVIIVEFFQHSTKEIEYVMNETRISFQKKMMNSKVKDIISVPFENVVSYSLFSDFANEKDLILTNCISSKSTMKMLVDQKDGTTKTIIFSPDDYLKALLDEILVNHSSIKENL